MICSFEALFKVLSQKPSFEYDWPLPNCPKSVNMVCAKAAGDCAIGNKRQCRQRFVFFVDGAQFIVSVIYVYQSGTRTGYFLNTDGAIKRLLYKATSKKHL